MIDKNFINGYSVIPTYILNDKDLTNGSKLLYARLSSLTNAIGYSWATNKYLAEASGITTRQIGTYLAELAQKNHINVVLSDKNKRLIYLTTLRLPQEYKNKQEKKKIEPLIDYDWLNEKD